MNCAEQIASLAQRTACGWNRKLLKKLVFFLFLFFCFLFVFFDIEFAPSSLPSARHSPRRPPSCPRRTAPSYWLTMSGPVLSGITEKLRAAFAPSHMQVLNESANHNVPKDAETHFKVN